MVNDIGKQVIIAEDDARRNPKDKRVLARKHAWLKAQDKVVKSLQALEKKSNVVD